MGLEKTVINELDEHTGVQDVYFSEGNLHVMNGYDLKAVTGYMLVNYPSVKVIMDEDYLTEAFNPFDTVNS
jgi:hypothetical protein